MSNVLEVKTMNRQQRRRQKKNLEWINSLSKDKQEIINAVVQERAKSILRRSEEMGIDIMLDNIGTSIAATLIYKFDAGENEIADFLETFDKFFEENVDFVKREGKDWKMKLEKMEPKVLEKVESLLKQGVLKKTLVEEVRKTFPELTSGQIFNAYKLAKGRIAAEKNKKDTKITTEDAVNYVFADEVANEVIEKVNEDIKEEKQMSKLKVIKKEILLEGEYGTYRVSDGMVANSKNELFESLEDVEKYEKAEIERFARKMSELKEVMQYI